MADTMFSSLDATSQAQPPPPPYSEAASSARPLPHIDTGAAAARPGLASPDSLSSLLSSTTLADPEFDDAADAADKAAATRDDATLLDAALSFAAHAAPPPALLPTLARPVALPRLAIGLSCPYARAYAPALADFGVSVDDFVAFVDGLNVVMTDYPPLKLLGMAGQVVGQVPVDPAQIAGAVAQLSAAAGIAVLSKTRAVRFLHRANAAFFHPRGLHAAACSAGELRGLARIPADAPLAAPLAPDSLTAPIVERRMAALRPWLADLALDVPPPAPSAGALRRLCERQVCREAAQLQRRAVARRLRAIRKTPGGLSAADAAVIADGLRASGDRRLVRRADKFERQAAKAVARDGRRADKGERQRARVAERAERDIARVGARGVDAPSDLRLAEIERRRDKELALMDAKAERSREKSDRAVTKTDSETRSAQKGKWLVVSAWDGTEEDMGLLKRILTGGSVKSSPRDVVGSPVSFEGSPTLPWELKGKRSASTGVGLGLS